MSPTRAWIWLLGLSAASTLAGQGLSGPLLTLTVLGASFWKARVILAAYLGLQRVPGWQRVFDLGLAALTAVLIVLALA